MLDGLVSTHCYFFPYFIKEVWNLYEKIDEIKVRKFACTLICMHSSRQTEYKRRSPNKLTGAKKNTKQSLELNAI
jgi:hypothetical protein